MTEGILEAKLACRKLGPGESGLYRALRLESLRRPEHRGRAVGAALMRKLLQLAFALEGIDQVELRVVSTNAAALRLYAKLGFEQFGLQKNFFKDAGLSWDQCFLALTRERYVISLLTSRP